MKRPWRIVWLPLLVALTVVQAYYMLRGRQPVEDTLRTRESLRRLAQFGLARFSGEKPPRAIGFWEAMGRKEPMRDPWGTPFLLAIHEGRWEFRSAGPDQREHTADDLTLSLPLAPDGALVVTQPEVSPQQGAFPAMDAR